ncbi:iron-containing alcohol dehydrogenase [uncultured Cetobacterium sp.]|uniref:iron-containing alcohol dehydrogenase n=1 Tax=uncultured Cetobacterium sp. TaxID=527638 RepID=UPI0025F61FD9|nr:iron-containing alcohol dehydrogenase [uncultured Cetobacterium sp.]
MLNFNFYNPTHIVFGKDTLDQLNSLVPADAKVLITYGGGSVNKFGTLDKVIQNLPGREIFQFGGIEPNPQYSTLMKAVQIAKDENVDFLLAVGGGSVMDGTKFIALASRYEGDCLDLLTPEFDLAPVDSAIPMGTVVTLPATGSEMNNGAVISHKNLKVPVFSMFTFPKFSILDPTLTFTLPTTQVANGIIDTFIHTVEQYVTYPVDARFQDRTAEGILKTLIEIGKTTIDEPTNYDARANLVWCATMALNGLIGAGVPQDWTTHMIGHEVTAMFGIDHAKTLAILQPAIWEIRKDKKRAKLIQYAERVWDITEADENLKIELAIQKTRAFFEDLGVKTHLSDYDMTAERIEDLIEALNNNNRTALSETGDLTLEISREILKKAL